jgi:membrane dipeptidase
MNERIKRLHREAPLCDVHIHPSMKMFLLKRNLWRHYWSGNFFNPFSSRSDFRVLEKGGVGLIWATHHLIEKQIAQDCWLICAALFLTPAYSKIMKGPRIERTLYIMDRFERELRRKTDRTELARSVADIHRIRQEGKMAFVHAVEGGHVLEGKIDNLNRLAERGVACLTLTHFYKNELATQVDAIPQDQIIKKLCTFNFDTGGEPPLTGFGKSVLQRMKELKMIPDISHCTPEARQAIYAEVKGEMPIVASHVGVQRYQPDIYNLTDAEILEIKKSGGGIGVIFYNYWLHKDNPKDGLETIWKTMQHIHEVTDSWDHVLIGTDFDGFTDPPNDVKNSAHMPKVTEMLLRKGLSETDIKKILGGNALRILEQGWR